MLRACASCDLATSKASRSFVVDPGVVVEHDQAGGRMDRQRQFNCLRMVVNAGGNDRRLGLGDEASQLRDRCAGWQRNPHCARTNQRKVGDGVVNSVEIQNARPITRPRGLVRHRGSRSARARSHNSQ
jgi:hypothetical protein